MAGGVQYLALLRGINVGGKNLVKMEALRGAFEELGLDDVATYIASGNVLFRAKRQKADELAARIERQLAKAFGFELRIVLVTEAQLAALVAGAPRGFGSDTDRCDVVFVRKPLTVAQAFALLRPREGVDRAWKGRGAFYHARLDAEATKSRFGRIVGTPEYENLTIRSWNTTTKLLALMESRAQGG